MKSALPSGLEAEALYLRGDRKTREVQGGFALWMPGGGVLYGHRQGELLGSLGVAVDRSRGIDPRALDGLAQFAQEKGLLLVDWRRCVRLEPEDPHTLQQWLASWR